MLKEYSRPLSMLLRIIDVGVIFFSGWIAYFCKFHTFYLLHNYSTALFISVALTLVVFPFFHIYDSIRAKRFWQHVISLAQAIGMLLILLAGLAFLTKTGENFSRSWFMWWGISAFVLLSLFRCSLLVFLHLMRARGWNERRVIIIGAGELGQKLALTMQQAVWTGFRVVAMFDDHASEKALPTPSSISDYLSASPETIDEIWIALPLRAEPRVKEILHDVRHHAVTTRFVLDIFGMSLLNHSISDLAGFPVLNICSTPMKGMNRVIKAIEDRVLASIILVLISPLLLLIALSVKCSSTGPILFKQDRHGWDGRIIKIYKFRTMVEHQEEFNQVTQAKVNDERVTAFGRFLRKYSLDELPQFINVLQGRMSIVGPRPHALAHNEFYKNSINAYMQRHKVKPGITGWAQVNGWRGETDTLDKMQMRVEYDLYYIEHWSLMFDLKIIFLTLLQGFIHKNAY